MKGLRTKFSVHLSGLLIALATATAGHGGTIRYVDDDAPLGGDGTSWDTAYRFLQDALTDASGGGSTEIRVAQGIYKPDQDEAGNVTRGDRTASFVVTAGLHVAGGYAGIGHPDPDQRDIDLYPSILSGDLLGDDQPGFLNVSDNSHHVARTETTGSSVELDGLVLTAGNADNDAALPKGAGLLVFASPTIVDCTFQANLHSSSGSTNGGAGLLIGSGSPTLTGCRFLGNHALGRGAGVLIEGGGSVTFNQCIFADNFGPRGGGMYVFLSEATVTDCIFEGNTAGGGGIWNQGTLTMSGCFFEGNMYNPDGSRHGAAIYNDGSGGLPTAAMVVNCRFLGGVANRGGGIYNFAGEMTVIGCLFAGNTALFGGGFAHWAGASGDIINCTFVDNAAFNAGGGVYINGAFPFPVIANCIFWGNTDTQIEFNEPFEPVVRHSDVQGGWPGATNIDADPLLDSDYRPGPGSPVIDAGSNADVPSGVVTDLDGNARFVDDPDSPDCWQAPGTCGDPPIVDMGAYEFQGTGLLVPLDIKPGGCPNSFNRSSHGVLPVTLVGTDRFDVMEVDLSTILLSRADGVGGSVAPNEGPPGPHSVFEDVATPFEGELCDCHELAGDGILDLAMKFRTDDVVAALLLNDLLPAGDLVELVVSGALLDGTEFSASDCIRLVPPGTPPGLLTVESNLPGVWIDVAPLDPQLDSGGFASFERTYPLGSVVTLVAPQTYQGWTFAGWKVGSLLVPRTTVGLQSSQSIDIVIFADHDTIQAVFYAPSSSVDSHPR